MKLGSQETTYVKSPVASGCLACSSVRKRVRVTMLVLTFSVSCPLFVVAIVNVFCEGRMGMRGGEVG